MKILYLAKAYPPETGGVETYSEQVAMAYARAGHEVTVVTTHPGAVGEEMRGGVKVTNVGDHGSQAAIFGRMARHLWSLRHEPFDAVHATTWRVSLPALLLRRGLPMVLTIHGREVFVVPKPLRPMMMRALRHADHLPTVSQPILDKFEQDLGFRLKGAFSNWNGISFEEESGQPHDKPAGMVLFCMCRLVARKNVDGAIRAVAELVGRGHDITFRIAGGGEEADSLAALVRELGMEEHVTLLGRVPDEDIQPLYRGSHIFLHPQIATRSGQDMEGFGLTIADAMSFGCVPVAGASGGPLDFIRNGETGYLVDGTKTGEIVTALERLITDPAHREALAAAARDFALAQLTWDAHARKILERLAPTA
ncbi:glycosyltransferase family 4 protein [Salipiger thiooxidans]|uniref:glycosyltransferase family 4 protein n=1 Tax=Salipiger thiooxidans TaxID=282683 RepID=UPI001CD5C973|nr:glycosyltransferase family 4 protein [Salipiger thiooxidans]MCA0849961.1 glycosyltransferase family 4 protein [Salipiger thiooxidans]